MSRIPFTSFQMPPKLGRMDILARAVSMPRNGDTRMFIGKIFLFPFGRRWDLTYMGHAIRLCVSMLVQLQARAG